MKFHLFKLLVAAFIIVASINQSAFCEDRETAKVERTFFEVTNPTEMHKSVPTSIKVQAVQSAASFDFNDGTVQDWYVVGAYDETGAGPFSSHFSASWADAVSYPTSGLSDPIGNGNGSYKICNVMGHGITNPGASWWYMYWISPDLSSSPTWQDADGYSIRLMNYMDLIGAVPGTHLDLYVNLLVTIYDHDAGINKYFRSYENYQEIQTWAEDPSWIHLDMDWSGLYSSIPNYTIKEVYIGVMGSMSDYFEGGVYLDEVVPFTNIATDPQITYQPAEFDISLLADDMNTESLIIGNTGDAALTFTLEKTSALGVRDLSIKNSANFAQAAAAKKVLLTGWGTLNTSGSINDMVAFISSLGMDVDTSQDFPGSLAGYDAVILVGAGSADDTILEGVVDNFIQSGKGLIIFEGAVESGNFAVSAHSNPVQSYSGWSYRSNTTVVDPANPLVDGVSASTTLAGWSTNPTMKPGANVAATWNDGAVFAATYEYSSGKVAYFNDLQGWYSEFWRGDLTNGQQLLENALNYVLGSGLSWLQLSSNSGTVQPGNTSNIGVTFDATDLAPTTYTAAINIHSNDPDYSLIQIPVSLEVQPGAAPVLTVNPTQLDFENIVTTKTFQISNTGSGDLTWSVSENPDEPWITSISPTSGTNDATITVTVDRTPISSFDETGTLTVTSNGGTQDVTVTIEKEIQLPPHWLYTSNTGNSAVVVLPTAAGPNIDGDPLQADDYVGVFTTDGLCCGWRQWQNANLSLTAWGDDDQTAERDGFQPGQQLHYRVYRLATDKEWEFVEVGYSQGTGNYAANAFMVLNTFNVIGTVCQTLGMDAGWNMFSLNVYPEDPNINIVMNPVASDIVIVKNGAGQTYIPEYGINDIGSIQFEEGYQIYCKQSLNLDVCGQPIPADTPLPLPAGWSIFSYILPDPMDISSALTSIHSILVIAKNNLGQTYIPEYGINDIGDMQPGQGYQAYLKTAGTIQYPLPEIALPTDTDNRDALKKQLAEHFLFTAATGNNATIVVTTAANPRYSDGTPLAAGDEIGVFTTDGLCCGAAVWQGENKSITIWGDDNQTTEQDGFLAGDTLRFIVWKQATDSEYPAHVSFQENQPVVYQTNGFSVVTDLVADISSNVDIATDDALIPTQNILFQNYPNPFNPDTHIPFQLANKSRVTLQIFDLHGRHIRTLINAEKSPGQYTVIWNGIDSQGAKVASGIYLYRLEASHTVLCNKMILLK